MTKKTLNIWAAALILTINISASTSTITTSENSIREPMSITGTIHNGDLYEDQDDPISNVYTPAYASPQETNNENIEEKLLEIKKAIKENNAGWTASYTSASQAGGLGCIEEEVNEFTEVSFNGMLPDRFDWRNVDGVDWTTPVKSQGDCGSCVAFATIGAVEAVVQINVGQPFECDLSEAHLFFCGGGSCSRGMHISTAVGNVMDFGVPDELCFPYSPNDMSCSDTSPNWPQRAVRVSEVGVVQGIDNIRNALVTYGPLAVDFEVYEDFPYYDGGIYEHVYGIHLGGHAVTLVGYDNIDKYWICKNSWGKSWGERGWFRIKYGECKIDDSAYYFHGISGNIQPFSPCDPTPSDQDKNIDINVELSWNCYDPDGDDIFYDVYLNKGHTVDENDIVATGIGSNSLIIENLEKDSLYTWKVMAHDEHGCQHEGPRWRFTTRPPATPEISGPRQGKMNEEYTYTAWTRDEDGEVYYWYFDWGDDTNSGWIGPLGPGEKVNESHIWIEAGDFTVKVRYKEDGKYSDWATHEMSVPRDKARYSWFRTFLDRHPMLRYFLGV